MKKIRPEVGIFGIILLLLNIHLLFPVDPQNFNINRVASGEWWRVFTFPFVHISLFHLALDAGAFFLLYNSLEEKQWTKRLAYIALCSFASLALTLVTSAQIQSLGLCGLSGIAHGLMAVSSLEMIHSKKSDNLRKIMGLCSLSVVVAKSIYEAFSGHVLFEWLYFGLVGTPLVMTHCGGVLGGISAFYIVQYFFRSKY